MSDDRVSTTVRLPKELLARLDAECNRRVVGRNLVITAAIDDFVTHLERCDDPTCCAHRRPNLAR